MLISPHLARKAHTRLHLVDDEHELVLIGERAQLLEELVPKVVVPSLTLDGLDDESRDVVLVLREGLLDLRDGFFFRFDHLSRLSLHGEFNLRIADRGQSNFGKYMVFRGSAVLVSESV